MNLSLLDKLIPKRWVLLLRYYLPFFKKPAPFYWACRQLINELKRTARPHSFPLNRLAELLFILDNYSRNDADLINLAKKIIGLISAEQYQQIDHLLLRSILFQFDPEDNQTVILNDVLQRIPNKTYQKFISLLSINQNKALNLIKWCARLADRFILADKLELILSLPDQLVSSQVALLHSLVFTELKKYLKVHAILNTSFCEKFLSFMLKWQKDLNLSVQFLFNFFYPWLLKEKNPLLVDNIKSHDVETQLTFFATLLQHTDSLSKKPIQHLPPSQEKQYAAAVESLIMEYFASISAKNQDSSPSNRMPSEKSDLYTSTLIYLLGNITDYPINLFQFLALSSLARKPLDQEKLKKISLEKPALLESAKFFSIELQKYVAEIHINAIRDFIISKITEFSPEKSERHSIPHRLARIREGDLSNTNPDSVAALDQIFEEIKMHLPLELKQECQILLALLKQLNLLLENPAIEKLIQQQLITAEKLRQAAEERIEAQLELKRRIAGGLQSSVSFQRMEELYGEKSEAIQKQWTKQHLINFFDASTATGRTIGYREGEAAIELNRELRANYPYPIL